MDKGAWRATFHRLAKSPTWRVPNRQTHTCISDTTSDAEKNHLSLNENILCLLFHFWTLLEILWCRPYKSSLTPLLTVFTGVKASHFSTFWGPSLQARACINLARSAEESMFPPHTHLCDISEPSPFSGANYEVYFQHTKRVTLLLQKNGIWIDLHRLLTYFPPLSWFPTIHLVFPGITISQSNFLH